MLSNAYFLAKFRFDTAENEPAKNLQNFRKMHLRKILLPLGAEPGEAGMSRSSALNALNSSGGGGGTQSQRASVGKISAKCCSFSAVSAPIFARKYAFDSIFQNLPDYLTEIFEIWQYFKKFATFAKILLNFHENC